MTERASFVDFHAKSPTGIEISVRVGIDPGESPAEIATYVASVDAELKRAGVVRSERLEPAPRYGGGGKQQRPEIAPPAGIIRPQHCGEPMKYIRYSKKDKRTGDPVKVTDIQKGRGLVDGQAEMWVCAQDKQCADFAKESRAAANFDMKPIAADTPTVPVAGTPAPIDDSAPAGPPQGYGEFLNRALKLGYTRGQVLKIAHTNDDELKRFTPDAWQELLGKIEAEKQTAAPAA